MASPQIGHAVAKRVVCDFEERRFYINFGFNDRESIQVRLENNNRDVYLCYTLNEGKDIRSTTVTFDAFVDKFREMVDQIR